MATAAPPRLTKEQPDPDPPSPEAEAGETAGEELRAEPPPAPAGLLVASTALTILAALLLGFVVQLVVLSEIEHFRAQRTSYAQLRSELALGTAPVSALDSNGKPLSMGSPLALLEIPSLAVREVVAQGTTSGVLQNGPGHRRDTVLPGQVGTSVIMGRNSAYGGPFRKLDSLRVGDRITITTGQGVQRFGVLDVRRGGDPFPAAPGADESRLVLITATGAAYVPGGVLRVDAKLLSQVQPAGVVGVTASQLPNDEKPLSGEPGAWLSIVLWGQALLIAAVAFVWARARWGYWQSWLVGLPVLALFGLGCANSLIRLLPNLL